ADAADRTMAQLGYMHYDMDTLERSVSYTMDPDHRLGPFWLGPLHDKDALARMVVTDLTATKRLGKYLELWRGELDTEVFLYDMSELSSFMKLSPPRIDDFMVFLNEHGHAAKSHVCPTSFKTDIELDSLLSLYREFSLKNC
ncbi:MAG: N2,N2-dimethylguanosine tRNA methyltransferase, partial [Candidatus Methanomethylophilaceae archaeon]|nr:N2,N2-dimethylguanosine tRNA methyltransferase [Candidatus Methanomethylophilaceae archaeon]